MASEKPKGTAFRGPQGQIAIRMNVPAGQYLVVDPDNGGYYSQTDDETATIESWSPLTEYTAITTGEGS